MLLVYCATVVCRINFCHKCYYFQNIHNFCAWKHINDIFQVFDWLPTLLEAAGYEHPLPSNLDGISQWQSLSHNGKAVSYGVYKLTVAFGQVINRNVF